MTKDQAIEMLNKFIDQVKEKDSTCSDLHILLSKWVEEELESAPILWETDEDQTSENLTLHYKGRDDCLHP